MVIQQISRDDDDGCISFDHTRLSEKFLVKAEEELFETNESRQNCLKEMKDILHRDEDFRGRLDDAFLLQFLRARKFNTQRALLLLKKFYAFRKKHIEVFQDVDYKNVQALLSNKTYGFLPQRDKDGCVIFTVRLGQWDPLEIPVEDAISALIRILYHSIENPMNQINGYRFILDFYSQTLRHLRYCTPYYASLIYQLSLESFPARFKAIHILNPAFVFKAAWTVIQPFLPEKIKKRVYIHKPGKKTLLHFLPASVVPVEFGGELKQYDNTCYYEHITSSEQLKLFSNCELP